ncbi:MAG: NAD-dependent epimerase/dehydratase family protein [Myxococcaceae bacterium]
MRIVITGGAGFVGSSLATTFRAKHPKAEIFAFDNLKRRGSELNLERFRQHGISFVHGDVRQPEDLAELPSTFDLLIDASAEPSVLAGLTGSPAYLLSTNLGGTLNCLELVRARGKALVFLSTSRVYSMGPLRELALDEGPTRLNLAAKQAWPGVGARGIAESFPVHLPRSLYGATKLASELIIQEYVSTYGMRAVINRCGVIAGPGQFGKVDQGVFTLWVAHHVFDKPLKYTGFGGAGKQVRDLLHPDDLAHAIDLQLSDIDRLSGETFNLGGGPEVSTSLAELTATCQRLTGRSVPVASDPTTSPVDIPHYVTDFTKAEKAFGWKPQKGVEQIVSDIHAWLGRERSRVAPLFGAAA